MKRILVTLVAVVAIAVLLTPALRVFAQPEFADQAFERVWNRQDRAVYENFSDRSWTWGPENLTEGLQEEYEQGDGGTRVVQYFDKSRMEINDPDADQTGRFFVTNGLLPIEMMTGELQTGDNSFDQRGRAQISAIGDPGNFPTYSDLSTLFSRSGDLNGQEVGQPVTTLLNQDGTISQDYEAYTNDPLTVLVEDPNGTGYAIPQAFINYQNESGLVFENNNYVTGQVYDPLFVFGLPVTAPYWVESTVGGESTPILFQIFERRVITYNPANNPSFRVEMGNVGRHYYEWRYGELPGEGNGGEETPTETAYPAP